MVNRAENGARPGAGTPERARASVSHKHSITSRTVRQPKVSDLLSHGQENGLHLRDLVKFTGWTEREVRAQIHRERRQHIPILSNNRDGYYLPGDEQERAACVRSMRHRAAEILAGAPAIGRAGASVGKS